MSAEVVILDFETTGLSAGCDRIIEIGAAIVNRNKVTQTFSELCNPGMRLPYFITDITGITDNMLKGKPKPEAIMPQLKQFIGDRPILAHNASFDAQFLHSEMKRAKLEVDNQILCTLLLSRRLIQNSYDYKLGTLKKHIRYKESNDHKDHRALDDVKVTAALWIYLRNIVEKRLGSKTIDFSLYTKIAKMPKSQVDAHLDKLAMAL